VLLPELLAAPATESTVTELLHQVIDPELGINIVDLGLLREVAITPEGSVQIVMTLTTPACPLGPYITEEVQQLLAQVSTITDVEVEVVWSPAWEPERDMSANAKQILGWTH
jgi:metal-sulfur cluster biosynthetic enzyme